MGLFSRDSWLHPLGPQNDYLTPVGENSQIDFLNLFGPGSKTGGPPENEAANTLARISQQMFSETTPVRQGLINRSAGLLNEGNIVNTPLYGGIKSAVDTQFQRARDNTIARTASGGALTDALTNLEVGRANTMAQQLSSGYENELNRALGIVTGQVPTSTGGLGQAANIQQQQIAQQQAQQAQSKQTAGTAIGSLIAAFAA